MTNLEPPEVKYCPQCKVQYICTGWRNHTRCADCEVDLVDPARYEEIVAEREDSDEHTPT